MWQRGHLRAQSCFLWSMTCISARKKKVEEKTLFSPKVKQDPTHRTATWVKSLRSIFSLRAADVFIIWGAGGGCPSSLQWCLKREVGGSTHTNAHTRAFMSLGSRWPSTRRLPPRTARLSFISPPPAPPRCKVINGETCAGHRIHFHRFQPLI